MSHLRWLGLYGEEIEFFQDMFRSEPLAESIEPPASQVCFGREVRAW